MLCGGIKTRKARIKVQDLRIWENDFSILSQSTKILLQSQEATIRGNCDSVKSQSLEGYDTLCAPQIYPVNIH